MSDPISNPNAENSTIDASAELRNNIDYIKKFGLPPSVAQNINFWLIFNDVHINDPIIASNIELNSYVFYYLENYQFSQSFVINYILEVFHKEFHGWGYTEFSKLNQHVREAFQETFMAKKIYMGRPNVHLKRFLISLVIDEQLLIWDKRNLCKYKKIYLTLKVWVIFESEFDVLISQQLTPSIKVKIHSINN